MTTANITIIRGDTNRWQVTVTDDETGAVVNLTGASAWFTLKNSRRDLDTAKLLQKTVGAGILLSDPTGGKLRIILDPADTVNLSPLRLYAWDLQVKTATGEIFTSIAGAASVVADVTRAIA